MYDTIIKKIDQMLIEKSFNGTVLIAHQSKVLWSNEYGFADFELDVLNSEKTKFRIGSITKTITAVAILKLIENNELKLEDSLKKFISNYPNGEKITIHHLLTHTSGISNFELDIDFYNVINASSFSDKLIDLFKYKPLQFEPGTSYAYSVSGYFLLGYIIEKVSGLSYEAYLKANIFDPLNMWNSGFDDHKKIIKHRAKGYEIDGSIIRNADFFDMRIAGAGGGLYSTVSDLYLFLNGLMNDKIINKECYHMMMSNQVRINDHTHYGFGIFLAEHEICGKNRLKHYHTGGGPGVRSLMVSYPTDQFYCFMISNINDKQVFNDAHGLMEEILFTNI